jgi:hypothetical protein
MSNRVRNIDAASFDDLKRLVLGVMEENAQLRAEVGFLKEEIARLKGLKGKPDIKPPSTPSGMEKGTNAANNKNGDKKRRGSKIFRAVPEDRIIKPAALPQGSRFKGYEDFTVQDMRIEARTIRFRRERWVTPDGETIIAPLPEGIDDHVGPELKRFILVQYHQGQTTMPRLVALLKMLGLTISERQVVRVLNEAKELFIQEARDVLRAAFKKAAWISVDDTGARHKGTNGFCTQMGNNLFTFFVTTASKSRLNFLELLRAGYTDYVLNNAAFDYMKKRNLAQTVIAKLAAHPCQRFVDTKAWQTHLEQLGLTGKKVHPDPVLIATEGALWGAIADYGFLNGAVILSDDAGQFNIGEHALCWVHAERLIYKLNAFTDAARNAKEQIRALVWDLYKDLKAYKDRPTAGGKTKLRRRFDGIFSRKTGFVALDRLLVRLRANKAELLRVLEHPDLPLNTNGSENDIRCQVTRRKISATTRSDQGRDCRDAFLSLTKTCMKLGISFWDYLGDRLYILPRGSIPYLPDLVILRS